MKLVHTLTVLASALSAMPAFAQAPDAIGTTEPPKANIASAVTCQVLISQFDDSVAASKVEDAVKASARALRGDGNKACNAWNYEDGIGNVRVAIETIGRKPVR
jgi:hypothetical protein